MISIVIPVRNAAGVIGEQLEALAPQVPASGCEVIVVDNGSTDGTAAVVEGFRDRLPALRVLDAADKAGVCFARNAGARAAEGDYLLFLDADDRVAPGWYSAMVDASRDHAAIGGDMAWFQVVDGQEVCTKPPYGAHPDHGFDFLPSITGGNSGMAASVLAELGGWNEDYDPVGGDDVDLYWRAHLAGHPTHFVAGAIVNYRTRSGGRALLRQSYRDGRTHPHLFRDFSSAGMPPSSPRAAVRAWLLLVKRLPGALVDPRRRRSYLSDLGHRAGRLVGSFRYRTLYL